MYKAVICRVKTRPHPNADRIQLGNAYGYQVIVGLDTQDGELGIFFPPDGQLSDQYVRANDLYARDPETGEKGKGFFGKNRRVTAQNFRGQKSEGYWASLDSLKRLPGINFVKVDALQEGDRIDSIDGFPLCQKYFTPATQRARANQANQPRKQNRFFHKHFDTDQLKREITSIPDGATLYFTEKLHGTSQRSGRVLDERPATLRQKVGSWIAGDGWIETVEDYEFLLGTRNVILGQFKGESYYGSEGFRHRLDEQLRESLRKGETVYYEVLGFTDEGRSIMPSVVIPKELPEIREKYGSDSNRMHYTYGNWEADSPASPRAMGGCEMYVYRITQQNSTLR